MFHTNCVIVSDQPNTSEDLGKSRPSLFTWDINQNKLNEKANKFYCKTF